MSAVRKEVIKIAAKNDIFDLSCSFAVRIPEIVNPQYTWMAN